MVMGLAEPEIKNDYTGEVQQRLTQKAKTNL
jgi:hypothetical protein